MQFLYSPLTWGFLLVGVPILVHLINLLRHRRQPWAAMEFLLESYRRNRRWVMLKQWLLLLARMLAMGLLVMMLAKWVSSAQWLSWLGGRTTHHFLLIDDSCSMDCTHQGESAYTRAMQAMHGLVRDISNQPGDHQLTLVRWSRAALALREQPANDDNESQATALAAEDSPQSSELIQSGGLDLAADLLAQTVPDDPSQLLQRVAVTAPSGMQLSPEAALELVMPSIVNQTGELPIVYLVTDLRRNQFSEAQELKKQLLTLAEKNVPVHLIDCEEQESNNLTVTNLGPTQEVWAAGVPLIIQFAVRNNSSVPVKNVTSKVRMISFPDGSVSPNADQPYSGLATELPPVVIEAIEPGQTVARQFQVVFSAAGQHVIELRLPDDCLAMDNRRLCTIDLRQSQRVLLVDGDPLQSNAFYFESVMQPGDRLATGFSSEKVDSAYLRDVSADELSSFDVVALLDVPRLDSQAVNRLEEFCRSGGGLLLICGSNTNINLANQQLYREGLGLLPVELEGIIEPEEPANQSEPHVTVSDHPILAPLTKLSSSPFFALRIRKQYVARNGSWNKPGLETVASGPQGSPLMVDQAFGNGRVVTLLTGLSPDWSSWAQDPTFVVVALRSMGYLGSFRRPPTEGLVGEDLEMFSAGRSILPDANMIIPTSQGPRIRLQRQVEAAADDAIARLSLPVNLHTQLDGGILDAVLQPGLFELWMTDSEGRDVLHNIVHNVPAEEGMLERISHEELRRQMTGADLQIRTARNLASSLNSQETAQSGLLLAVLVAILLGEQALAYSASYHASAVSRRASGLSTLSPQDGSGR